MKGNKINKRYSYRKINICVEQSWRFAVSVKWKWKLLLMKSYLSILFFQNKISSSSFMKVNWSIEWSVGVADAFSIGERHNWTSILSVFTLNWNPRFAGNNGQYVDSKLIHGKGKLRMNFKFSNARVMYTYFPLHIMFDRRRIFILSVTWANKLIKRCKHETVAQNTGCQRNDRLIYSRVWIRLS